MAESFKTIHEHILEYTVKDLASKPAETLQKKLQKMVSTRWAEGVAKYGPPSLPGQPRVTSEEVMAKLLRAGKSIPPESIGEQIRMAEKEALRGRGDPVYLTWMTPQFQNMLAKLLIPGVKAGGAVAVAKEADIAFEKKKVTIFTRGLVTVFENLHKSMMSWWGMLKGYVFAPVFDMLKYTLMPLLNPVQDFLINLVSKFFYPIATRIGPKLQDIFLNLGLRLMPKVEQAGKAMGDWLMDLLGRFEAWTKSEDFDEWMTSTAVFFKELYRFVKKDLYPFVKDILVPLIKSIYEDFKPIAQAALEHPKTTLAIGAGAYATAKYDLIGKLFQVIGFASLSRELVALRLSLLGTTGATTGTTAAVGLLTKGWQVAALAAALLVGYGIGKLLDKFLGISERMSEWYLFLMEMQSRLQVWLYDTFVAPVLEWLKPVGEALKSVGVWLWENLITPAMNFGAKVGEWLGLDKLMLGLVEFWGKSKEYFSPMSKFIQRPFSSLREYERMVEATSTTSGNVLREQRHAKEAAAKVISGATIVPQAQEGGMVAHEGLAYVHSGEVITPFGGRGSSATLESISSYLRNTNFLLDAGFTALIKNTGQISQPKLASVVEQALSI
jgi:hypothetical protein